MGLHRLEHLEPPDNPLIELEELLETQVVDINRHTGGSGSRRTYLRAEAHRFSAHEARSNRACSFGGLSPLNTASSASNFCDC